MKITSTQAVLDFFGDEQVIEDMLNNFNNNVEDSEDDSDYKESGTDEDSDDEEDSEVDEEEERHQFYRQEAQAMEEENILADLPELVSNEDSDTDVLEVDETHMRIPPPPPLRRERASDYVLPLTPRRVFREEDYMTPVRNTEVRTPNAPERRVLGDLTNITIRPRRLRFN